MHRITRAGLRRRLRRAVGRLNAPRVSVVVRVRPGSTGLAECLASIAVTERVTPEVVQLTTDTGLDEAVASATGDFLTFVEADDVLGPSGMADLVAALGDADLACATREVRRGPRPMAVPPAGSRVDLSLVGKLVRTSWWRSVGPPAFSWERQAVTVAALTRAARAVSCDVVLAEERERDVAAPIWKQRRYDVAMATDRIGAYAEVLDGVPAGERTAWCSAAVADLLPQLCRDAVGGGPSYAAVLGPFASTVIEVLPEEVDLPVEARILAWAAAHGSFEDLAYAAAWLGENPHGLPVTDEVVVVPPDLSLQVPDHWLRIRPVDRVLRARAWLVGAGERWELRGNAFLSYPRGEKLAEVSLDGHRLVAIPCSDPSADAWAQRAHEDHAASGFGAEVVGVPEAARSSGGGSTARIRLGGRVIELAIASLRPQPDALIRHASLSGGQLVLRGDGGAARLRLVGPNAATPWADTVPEAGGFGVSLPLVTTTFGEETPLPTAKLYRFEAEPPAAMGWERALELDPPELVGDRIGVLPAPGGLSVAGPLTAAQRSAFGQQRLVETYTAVSRADARTTVLFESFQGRAVSDNPAAIARALMDREPGLDLAWVLDEPAAVPTRGARAVARRTPAWYDALAHAHAYIANAMAPPWFVKKPGQVHLQTWHGTPLKRIGEDRGPGDLNTWRHRRMVAGQAAGWDALISPSPYCSEIFRSAFGYEGLLLEVGYPRNDVLLSAGAPLLGAETRRRLGISDAQRVVLYAPTWREYVGVRDSKPLFLDAERLTAALPDTVVLVRGHYNATRQVDLRGKARVLDVTRYPDIAELYLAADVLVTDYSSVMFDFALTDRPIVLLAPDLDQYRDVERGFYFDIEAEAPGALVTTTEEVVQRLLDEDRFAEARRRFRERFCPYDDGLASVRVCDELLELTSRA